MGLEIKLDLNLDHLIEKAHAVTPEALTAGMEHIRQVAAPRTPIETGRLVGSAKVKVDGDVASLTYDGPYARYQEERMDLRHTTGQSKYLSSSIFDGARDALAIVARIIKKAI